jgi:hypothetical protein
VVLPGNIAYDTDSAAQCDAHSCPMSEAISSTGRGCQQAS